MPRRVVLDHLRQQIRTLERTHVLAALPKGGAASDHTSQRLPERRWVLGIDAVDDAISAPGSTSGLDVAGVHEVKPANDVTASAAACQAAALGFLLALAGRLDASSRSGPHANTVRIRPGASTRPVTTGPILWCTTRARRQELGRCYGPGLAAFGIDPARLLLVESTRADEVLWALEEGLTSGAVALAVGSLDTVAATPARRLTLAAAANATPCLLLTHPTCPSAPTMATRWRVAPASSAPHPFAPASPGTCRLAVRLERCRARPLALTDRTIHMEWCDATFRFRLAAGSFHRTSNTQLPSTRAG